VRVNSREKLVCVSYQLAARYFSREFLTLNRACSISCKFLVRVFGESFSYEFLVRLCSHVWWDWMHQCVFSTICWQLLLLQHDTSPHIKATLQPNQCYLQAASVSLISLGCFICETFSLSAFCTMLGGTYDLWSQLICGSLVAKSLLSSSPLSPSITPPLFSL